MINVLLETKKIITNDDINEYHDYILNNITKDQWINIAKNNKWNLPKSQETKNKISESMKGKPSPNKDKVWIYSLEHKHSKLINKDELNDYIHNGYIKGRYETYLLQQLKNNG